MKKLLTGTCIGLLAMLHNHHAPAAPPAEHCPPELLLYDATGKVAGRYFPAPTVELGAPLREATVIVNIDGALIQALVVPDRKGGRMNATALRWQTYRPNDFASPDCSGPPLIERTVPGTRPAAFRRDASGDLIAYVGVDGVSFPQRSLAESSYGEGSCDSYAAEGGVWRQAWLIERIVNITQRFPEPLSVR
jgi:hypothetical protein